MDYLGWELERQRAALAALLLGGGKARDGEPARDVTRWSGAGTPDPYTVSSEEALGAWEAVRSGYAVWEARRDHAAGEAGATETAARSAWETILAGEAGVPARSRERAWTRLIREAGAPPEFPRSSGRYTARRGIRRAEADLAAEIQDLPAGSREDGAADNAASSKAGVNQNRAAGNTAAAGYPARFRGVRRRDMPAPYMLGRDGPAAGTAPWDGWGTAALRAEDSAKLLSRAVQRDARRYDGGFNIY